MGATQASAGVLAPYIEARDGGPLLDLTVRSLDLFDAFVARVAADSGGRRRRTSGPARSMSRFDADGAATLETRAATLLAAAASHARLLDAAGARGERAAACPTASSAGC